MLKLLLCCSAATHAYLTPSPRRRSIAVGAATDGEQWDSFTAHHVGEWFGAKTVYAAAGAIVDEDSVAITCLRRDGGEVTHVLKVPAASLAASDLGGFFGMASVKRKRKKAMNKHKHRKRRRRDRHQNK